MTQVTVLGEMPAVSTTFTHPVDIGLTFSTGFSVHPP